MAEASFIAWIASRVSSDCSSLRKCEASSSKFGEGVVPDQGNDVLESEELLVIVKDDQIAAQR